MTEIIYKKGDVTEAEETIIAHGCNALGVMGSGVAKAIRAKFPNAYAVYRESHNESPLAVGEVIYADVGDKIIANMITQHTVAQYSGHRVVDYEGLYQALENLNEYALSAGAVSVAMPRIGAGLGGGDWNIIAAMIESTSEDYQPIVYDI